MKYTKFFISAGHSNEDPGACANNYKERDIAVTYRNELISQLKALKYETLSDGINNDNKSLQESLKINKKDYLWIEFHMNASDNDKATGVESIALSDKRILCQKISDCIKLKKRGDLGYIDQSLSARGRLAVVNNNGIIVELGFISNKSDLDYILKNVKEICANIVKVITC